MRLVIHLVTTEYRNVPRWNDDGYANVETFVEGIFSEAEVAKVVSVRACGEGRSRWFRAEGRWIAGHRNLVPGSEFHFHIVQELELDPAQDIAYWGPNAEGAVA